MGIKETEELFEGESVESAIFQCKTVIPIKVRLRLGVGDGDSIVWYEDSFGNIKVMEAAVSLVREKRGYWAGFRKRLGNLLERT